LDRREIRGLGLPVPRLIQGTLHFGQQPADATWRVLDAAFEAGLDAFDTAAVYAQGSVESMLGGWIEQRGIRQSVTIIDKGCHPLRGVARMNPEELRRDLESSLDRLRTDYIDLYLLHRDDPEVPVGEIVSALNEARAAGRIRAFGASNWSHLRLQQASDYALAQGLVSFAASSPGLCLAEPLRSWPGCLTLTGRDTVALDWYRTNRVPLLAWSPLGGGFLTGRFSRENQASFEAPPDRRVLDFYASEANFARLDRLTELAVAKGLSPAQAALVYVLSQPVHVHAVVGCRDRAEITECTAIARLGFTPAELAWLDAATSVS
jgi:aryl-alcohol dehydrogenase-like predicted oxidoreductase